MRPLVGGEWPRVTLNEVVAMNPRLSRAEFEKLPTSVPFLGMAEVSEDGSYSSSTRTTAAVAKGYTSFVRGDVLVAKITPCFENGKATHVADLPGKVGFGSTEFHVLRPSSQIDGRYLFHLVWNSRFRSFTTPKMTGSAGQRRVPISILNNLEIPLPPLEEQRRITAILDKADAIRRKRAQALTQADTFLRSVFLEMFGDPVTNSKRLPLSHLGQMATIVTGNTPPRASAHLYGDGIEWIKSNNITTEQITLTEAKERLSGKGEAVARVAPEGSTLVTCIAGSPSSIGNAALANRRVAFNQQINAAIPKCDTHPEYLYALFRVGKRLVQRASTNSMKGLVTKSKFEAIEVPNPSTGDQSVFAEFFSRYRLLQERASRGLSQADNQLVSLAQNLLQ